MKKLEALLKQLTVIRKKTELLERELEAIFEVLRLQKEKKTAVTPAAPARKRHNRLTAAELGIEIVWAADHPLTAAEVAEQAIKRGYTSVGKTLPASFGARLYCECKKKEPMIKLIGPNLFAPAA